MFLSTNQRQTSLRNSKTTAGRRHVRSVHHGRLWFGNRDQNLSRANNICSRAKTSTPWETFPNKHVTFVDNGFPGTLPVVNATCVDQAITLGLALKGTINSFSTFDRKHYFYPDLPNGYQITQYFHPIITGGEIELSVNKTKKVIRLAQIQLEIDSAKSLHDREPGLTLLDFNRAGTGLLEIVTQPDFSGSEEASFFIRKLQHLLRHLRVSNAHMEDGELRCDVNVSVAEVGAPLGNRCEVKNVSSLKAIVKSIDFEIERQIGILESGGTVERETRSFDVSSGRTVFMRSKEDEVDYRFLPEPDLPPLIISAARIHRLEKALPELPDAVKLRFREQYPDLKDAATDTLVDFGASDFFEKVLEAQAARGSSNYVQASSWILNTLFAHMNDADVSIDKIPFSPVFLGQLLDLHEKGMVSRSAAKEVIELAFSDPNVAQATDVYEVVKEKNLAQISDETVLEPLAHRVLHEMAPTLFEKYANAVSAKNDYQIHKSIGVLVEDAMKRSERRGNPVMLQQMIAHLLNERYQQSPKVDNNKKSK